MDELKDKELEDLWEWCGLKYEVKNGFEYWYDCNGNFMAYCLPGQVASIIPVTLDNLFKWAMPKLGGTEVFCDVDFRFNKDYDLNWQVYLATQYKDDLVAGADTPAQALYLAIQKVRSQ